MVGPVDVTSDKRLGYSVVFGLLTLAGVGLMAAAPGQLLAAWGFAAAVLFCVAMIAAVHLTTET